MKRGKERKEGSGRRDIEEDGRREKTGWGGVREGRER